MSKRTNEMYNHTDEETPHAEDTQKLPPNLLNPAADSLSGDANNNPNIPLDPEKLGIDEFLADRLTNKPQGKYKFRKSIACGGMKMVLEVRDMDTMRDVAMAILPDAQSRPPADILRFVREARLTASLEHPNIVPVHDIGIDSNGAPYFTMKLLRGKTLAALLTSLQDPSVPEQKEYPLHRLLRIFIKICSGAAFAHSKGVLHLDLKPENIQLGDFGEVLIIDWGLARLKDAPEETGKSKTAFRNAAPFVTMDGEAKGTPGYMAPEQAAGRNSCKDERTDIYALGAILYAMITSRQPIEKKDVTLMIEDTVRGNIIPPRLRTPEREIPAALEAVVMKAMSTNPEDRYQSVLELRSEVNAFINGHATVAEKASVFKKLVLLAKRHAILTTVSSMFLFFLTVTVIFAIQEQQRRKSAWQDFCNLEFAKQTVLADQTVPGVSFLNQHLQPVTWYPAKNGLLMPQNEWMVLDYPLTQSWRLEIQFIAGSSSEFFEVRSGSPDLKRDAAWQALFGADQGQRDIFYRKLPENQTMQYITGTASCITPDRVRRVIIQNENGILHCRTGAMDKPLCIGDFLPPDAVQKDSRLALRAFTGGIRLLSVRFSYRQAPEHTTPLTGADTLLEEHLYPQAMQKYIRIAESYQNSSLCDKALLNAYQIAALYLPSSPEQLEQKAAIKKQIAARRNFAYTTRMREIDSASLWAAEEYIPSLQIAEIILKQDPENDILLRLPGYSRKKMPKDALQFYAKLLHKMKNLKSLDIAGLGFRSLQELRGLKLEYLNCTDPELKDFSGLDGMPLHVLITNEGIFSGTEKIQNFMNPAPKNAKKTQIGQE